MKYKKLELGKLEVQSFVTNINNHEQKTVKGGDTEDNTFFLFSITKCVSTITPEETGSGPQVCICQ